MQQLEQVALLPGMQMVIGLPDLHPGKGGPIGGAFFSQGILYPYLIGNDIGCGMGLWQTDLKQRKAKRDRWVKKLHGLEELWEGDPASWLTEEGLAASGWDPALGTIGGGNHFVELQTISSLEDEEAFAQADLDAGKLFLLVHSGSRGLGQHILGKHIEQYRNSGLEEGSAAAEAYLEQHNHALQWARLNRAIIADRFLALLGAEGERILDRCHNSLLPLHLDGLSGWVTQERGRAFRRRADGYSGLSRKLLLPGAAHRIPGGELFFFGPRCGPEMETEWCPQQAQRQIYP